MWIIHTNLIGQKRKKVALLTIPIITSDINNCHFEMSGLRQSRFHKKNNHRGVRVVSILTIKSDTRINVVYYNLGV